MFGRKIPGRSPLTLYAIPCMSCCRGSIRVVQSCHLASDKTPLTDPSAVAAYEHVLRGITIYKYAESYCHVSLDGLMELCLYGCFSMCVVCEFCLCVSFVCVT